jgi:hypothetical protein
MAASIDRAKPEHKVTVAEGKEVDILWLNGQGSLTENESEVLWAETSAEDAKAGQALLGARLWMLRRLRLSRDLQSPIRMA